MKINQTDIFSIKYRCKRQKFYKLIAVSIKHSVPIFGGSPACSLYHHTTTVFGPFSRTTWVSWCQKKTSGLYGARED